MNKPKCVMCGKEIVNAKSNYRKYCDECRYQRNIERVRECNQRRSERRAASRNPYRYYIEPERPRPKVSIADANAEARKHGMNYGQYWASKRG